MPWDGSGNFELVEDFPADRDAGLPDSLIDADKVDAELKNIRDGLMACLNRNGENAATQNIDFGGFQIDNLGDPENSGSAANIKTVLAGSLDWAGTFGGTANALTATLPYSPAPVSTGFRLRGVVAATNTSTTVTIAVNGIAAKRIKLRDGEDPAVGDLLIGDPIELQYDGTNYRVVASKTTDSLADLSDVDDALAPADGQILAWVVNKWTAVDNDGGVLSADVTVTDNALVRWNGTNAETIQNSVVTVSDSGVVSGAKIRATGGSVDRALVTIAADTVNVLDFGAVADGAYSAGTSGYAGTDNSAAFQAALDYANTNGKSVYVPAGSYRFARLAASADSQNLLMPTDAHWVIQGAGKGKTKFLIDGDITRDEPTNCWLRGTSGRFDLSGVSISGLWSYHPAAQSAGAGSVSGQLRSGPYMNLSTLEYVRLSNCEFSDNRWQVILGSYNKRVIVDDCVIERMTSDSLRFIGSNNVQITNNKIRWTDDDCISLHAVSTLDGEPVRSRALIANNVIEDCEGIVSLGAHTTIVTGNILARCHGSQIAVGAYAHPEGTNAMGLVIVTNNIIRDAITRYDSVTGWETQTLQSGAIIVGGAPLTASGGITPTAYDSGSGDIIRPYDAVDASAPWGAMNVIDWYDQGSDATVFASAGSRNFLVCNNIIDRTLPSAAAYSDWGYGEYFSREGWQDPAVADENFYGTGIALWSDMSKALINGNIVSAHSAGVFLYEHGQSTINDLEFRDIVISNNLFTGMSEGQGITTTHRASSSTSYRTWTVTVENNTFDIDPWHKSVYRTDPIDGTWTETAATNLRQDAINCRALKGWVIRGNIFRNCYQPITANADASAEHTIENNIVECLPVDTVYDAGNKGVAIPHVAGAAYKHKIIESDPTNTDWRKLHSLTPREADAQPSTGTWVEGTIVWNRTANVSGGASLIGWWRLTTGTGHVNGTDWTPLYVSASGSFSGGGGGSGDVVGPASATNNGLVIYDGTTGKVVKGSTLTGLLKATSGVPSAATAGTDYYAPGSTDVAVTDGGTGASNASGARTNLGLVIGTDVQAYSANLATWAGIAPSANGQSLVAASDYATMRGLLDLEAGIDFYSKSAADAAFQPLDGDLTAIAALSGTNTLYYRSGAATWSPVTIGANLSFSGGTLSASGGGGGGLSDADYGDITVSSAGTVMTIDAGVVTASKLASSLDVSGKTLVLGDANTTIVDTVDPTKVAAFDVSAITTGVTRTYTFQNASGAIALTGNKLSAFASTTSAELAGVISDDTGTGSLVFANSPVLVTPDLGTPSSVTLTNATGLPISTGVSGLGTGVATLLASNSAKNGVIHIEIDGGGSAPSTGALKSKIRAHCAGTLIGAYLYSDVSGSIVVDVSVNGSSIAASSKPTLSSATSSADTTLSGWTAAFVVGDIFTFNVDSASTLTHADLFLVFSRT